MTLYEKGELFVVNKSLFNFLFCVSRLDGEGNGGRQSFVNLMSAGKERIIFAQM